MSEPIAYIDARGIHTFDLTTVLTALKARYRQIYGADVWLEPDCQDGQWLSEIGAAINDCGQLAVAAYNSRGPATAQGAGLSSVVKINGIRRKVASYSTADVEIVGQAGVRIDSGKARDVYGYLWSLPDTFVIPSTGVVLVTATCDTLGDVKAQPGEISQIATPVPGWQSVGNPTAASPGLPVETDAQLRARQKFSTALPSQTILDGISGALQALPNVPSATNRTLRIYENDTDVVAANGVAPHTIAVVIDGGSVVDIANVIGRKKGFCGTYGLVSYPYTDSSGITRDIRFSRPADVPITYRLRIKSTGALTFAAQGAIKQAIADWTNLQGIGAPLYLTRAYMPANLFGGAGSDQFEVVDGSLVMARDGSPLAGADVAMAYNERPYCAPEFVQLVVG